MRPSMISKDVPRPIIEHNIHGIDMIRARPDRGVEPVAAAQKAGSDLA